MGQLIFTRSSQRINRARKINIFCNDSKIDALKNGELKTINLEPGNYEIYAKIDWCKTKKNKIEVTTDSTHCFELGSNLSGLNPLSLLYLVFINTSEYIYLNELES